MLVPTDRSLVSVDPSDGSVRWSVEHFCRSPDSTNATSPIVWNDLVLAVTGPGPGSLCLQLLPNGSYEEVWRDRRVLDSQFNSLMCIDGFAYGFSSKGQGGSSFRCVEIATGKLMWKWSSDLGRGQGLAVDGQFILLGEFGHLASLEVDPNRPVVLGQTDDPFLKAPCYSSPALADGRLYLRNERRLISINVQSRH